MAGSNTESAPTTENERVWIVTWNLYIHGVFDTEQAANDYVGWRWPAETRYGVKVEPHKMNSGWDPAEGGRTRAFPPASTSGEGLTGATHEAVAGPVDWKALYEQTSLRIHHMSRESARVRMPAELRDLLAVAPATS